MSFYTYICYNNDSFCKGKMEVKSFRCLLKSPEMSINFKAVVSPLTEFFKLKFYCIIIILISIGTTGLINVYVLPHIS